MPRKQTSPRRSATRKKSDSAATGAVIDIGRAASAHDEPDLEVVFDADLRPELAGSIARPLMREVYASRTALAAELVVSELMGMSRLACPPAASWDEKSEVVDALMSDVTAVAAADGSPPALALLRVIAVLAAPGCVRRCRKGSARAGRRGRCGPAVGVLPRTPEVRPRLAVPRHFRVAGVGGRHVRLRLA